MTKANSKTLYSIKSLVLEEVKKQGWRFVLYFSVIALAGVATIAPPKFYGYFVEHIGAMQSLEEASARDFLQNLLLFGACLALVLFLCNFARAVSEEWISLRIEGSLRCRFMKLLHKMPLEHFDKSQRGDWLTRMSGDIRAVEQFIALRLPNQISDAVVTLAIVTLFLTQNLTVAFFLICTTSFLACLNIWIQNKLTPLLEDLRELHGQVFQGLLENFEGIRSIRSYKAESFVLKNFSKKVQSIIDRGLSLIQRVGLLIGSNTFIVNALTAITLSIVALKLRSEEILLSDVFLYPFYIGMFYSSIFALVRGVFDWNDFFVHARRLDEVFHSTPPSEQNSYTKSFDKISFSNLQIFYEGHEKLTRNFDLSLKTCETLLIKGPSGCGKSTLLEGLSGLRTLHSESVKIFEKGSFKDFLQVKDSQIKVPIEFSSYVEQKPYLIEGSLRNNLVFSEKNVSDLDLWKVLKDVHLDSYFQDKKGLDFFIQDNGRNLSEGQKQRIGIARSLIHPRPFLMLDEPFASLDPKSILRLCNALNTLKKTHGLVIVSHIVPETLEVDAELDFSSLQFLEKTSFSKDTEGSYSHNLTSAPLTRLVEFNI